MTTKKDMIHVLALKYLKEQASKLDLDSNEYAKFLITNIYTLESYLDKRNYKESIKKWYDLYMNDKITVTHAILKLTSFDYKLNFNCLR